MSYHIADFTGQVKLNVGIHKWYPNKLTELQAIAAALNTDTSAHDTTLATAPAGLRPGNRLNSRFTNDVLLVVNAGKGGNLTPAAMSAAITSGISQIVPPTNTAAPTITLQTPGGNGDGSGNLYINGSAGTWTPAGSTFARQWRRGGTNIVGATSTTYTTVAADLGVSLTCAVTATNGAGSATAVSNALTVPA